MRHVLELFDLNDDELLALMQEVQVCARALKEVTAAVKINYEIHGNSLPHLHVHLYPRCRDDPFPGQAIDYHRKQRWYAEGEFEAFVAAMRQARHKRTPIKGSTSLRLVGEPQARGLRYSLNATR